MTAAERPKRATASTAASALRTSSTDGNPRNRRSASAVIAASSVTEQERVDRATPIARVAQEQVQRQRRNIVGDRIQHRFFVLMQDLHIPAAGLAGLGFHRCRPL